MTTTYVLDGYYCPSDRGPNTLKIGAAISCWMCFWFFRSTAIMPETDFQTDSYLRIAALSVALYEWAYYMICSQTAHWCYDYSQLFPDFTSRMAVLQEPELDITSQVCRRSHDYKSWYYSSEACSIACILFILIRYSSILILFVSMWPAPCRNIWPTHLSPQAIMAISQPALHRRVVINSLWSLRYWKVSTLYISKSTRIDIDEFSPLPVIQTMVSQAILGVRLVISLINSDYGLMFSYRTVNIARRRSWVKWAMIASFTLITAMEWFTNLFHRDGKFHFLCDHYEYWSVFPSSGQRCKYLPSIYWYLIS
jgi:hypothetical protein